MIEILLLSEDPQWAEIIHVLSDEQKVVGKVAKMTGNFVKDGKRATTTLESFQDVYQSLWCALESPANWMSGHGCTESEAPWQGVK